MEMQKLNRPEELKAVIPLAGGRQLELSRPLITGVLNVTPDSFSDGGQFAEPGQAVARALEMEEEGADIIDIGGESSRPGAEPVPVEQELKRVIPVIEGIRKVSTVPISIDTYKRPTAERRWRQGRISSMTSPHSVLTSRWLSWWRRRRFR